MLARMWLQALIHRCSTWIYGPGPQAPPVRWIGDSRIGLGGVPTATTLPALATVGVTHVVNCRSTLQTWLSQDLAMERVMFGSARVLHAPMWDNGRGQPPRRWAAAVLATVGILDDDPDAKVLVHCQHGHHRSVMVAHAVLRLRGYSAAGALALIRQHHPDADPVPAYTASVERWLANRPSSPGHDRSPQPHVDRPVAPDPLPAFHIALHVPAPPPPTIGMQLPAPKRTGSG